MEKARPASFPVWLPSFCSLYSVFPLSHRHLSIGVTARQVEKWPLFFEKIRFFSDPQRHNPQIPDDRHGWNSPPLISEKMRESVRGQCNFSEKSSGDDIPLYRGYRHPGGDFGPCFLKKSQFFFHRSSGIIGGKALYPLYSVFFDKCSVKIWILSEKLWKIVFADRCLYRGYCQAGYQIGHCFLKKAEIFSGAASEGYGSNPTRQPFFRVSEVSDLTAVLRTDSAEVFIP